MRIRMQMQVAMLPGPGQRRLQRRQHRRQFPSRWRRDRCCSGMGSIRRPMAPAAAAASTSHRAGSSSRTTRRGTTSAAPGGATPPSGARRPVPTRPPRAAPRGKRATPTPRAIRSYLSRSRNRSRNRSIRRRSRRPRTTICSTTTTTWPPWRRPPTSS